MLILTIRAPALRMTALVTLAVLLPAAMMLAGARVYRAILARHEVDAPIALREGLAAVGERTGVSFGRVLCVDPASARRSRRTSCSRSSRTRRLTSATGTSRGGSDGPCSSPWSPSPPQPRCSC